MRMRRRWPRLVTFVSVTTMLVTPAIASAESPAARPAGTDDRVCIYQGRTDTPEIGPLPCDTSRPYMIGRSGFSSSRIPSASEFNNGPFWHGLSQPIGVERILLVVIAPQGRGLWHMGQQRE